MVLKDGGDTYVNKDTDADRLAQYPTSTTYTNILDSDNYNSRASASGINAVSGLGTNNAGAWGAITQNNGSTGNDVAVLPGGSGATFGTAQKLIIRVWIEGEDGNCWNRNANQDWSISLRFTKEPLA